MNSWAVGDTIRLGSAIGVSTRVISRLSERLLPGSTMPLLAPVADNAAPCPELAGLFRGLVGRFEGDPRSRGSRPTFPWLALRPLEQVAVSANFNSASTARRQRRSRSSGSRWRTRRRPLFGALLSAASQVTSQLDDRLVHAALAANGGREGVEPGVDRVDIVSSLSAGSPKRSRAGRG